MAPRPSALAPIPVDEIAQWFDIPRADVEEMIEGGILHVLETLGESEGLAELSRRPLAIENRL